MIRNAAQYEYEPFDWRTRRAKMLLENAERHRLRGDEHLAAGRNEFANGSYKKAAKFMMKAQIAIAQDSTFG